MYILPRFNFSTALWISVFSKVKLKTYLLSVAYYNAFHVWNAVN